RTGRTSSAGAWSRCALWQPAGCARAATRVRSRAWPRSSRAVERAPGLAPGALTGCGHSDRVPRRESPVDFGDPAVSRALGYQPVLTTKRMEKERDEGH